MGSLGKVDSQPTSEHTQVYNHTCILIFLTLQSQELNLGPFGLKIQCMNADYNRSIEDFPVRTNTNALILCDNALLPHKESPCILTHIF